MQRKFLTNLILIVLLNLLVKPFYILGIDAEVQNRVGEEAYGNYFALLNFSFLLNILLDLGITNYNTRNIAQHPEQLTKQFYKIFTLRLLLFVLYAAVTLLSGFFIGYSGYEFYLLAILLFNQFLVAIVQFSRSNFNGLLMFRSDAFISVLDRSLLIIFCSLMLWTSVLGDRFNIEWFVYAQTLAYGLTAIISLLMLSGKVGKINFRIDPVYAKALLKKSFPYALLIFLMFMYTRIDAVMLERMLPDGDEQAGIYAQGFRILDAVNMFAALFAGLLLPIFARMIRQKENVAEMMELSFRILISASIVVAVICFWFRSELIELRYLTTDREAADTFGLLILSFIPISMAYIFGTLLTANGSLKQLNIMAVSGVVLNVTLNIVLIRQMEVIGAALATIITQWIAALLQLVLAYRILKIPFNPGLYLRIGLFTAVIIGSLYGFQQWLPNLGYGKVIGCLLLLAVLLVFALGLVKRSDLSLLLKKQLNTSEK